MAFIKIDNNILTSSLWVDHDARDLFLTALIMARPVELREDTPTIQIRSLDADEFVIPPGWYGKVEAASTGIIRMQGSIEREDGLDAIERLSRPEPESRSQENDGRRMVRVDGGFIILNYDKYRTKDHTAAERMKRYRAKKQKESQRESDAVVTECNAVTSVTVTQVEVEVEVEAEAEVLPILPPGIKKTSDDSSSSEPVPPIVHSFPETQGTRQEEEEVISLISPPIFLGIAAKLGIESGFAQAVLIEIEAAGGKDHNGNEISSPAAYLAARWRGSQAQEARAATKPAPVENAEPADASDEQRAVWKIEKDIERFRREIKMISSDQGNRNSADGHTQSKDDYRMLNEDNWLDVVEACFEQAKTEIPGDVAKFESSLDAARSLCGGSQVALDAIESRSYRLMRFAEFLPEDVPDFDKWDKVFNKLSAWRDPAGLKPAKLVELKLMKQQLKVLEGELRTAMVKV